LARRGQGDCGRQRDCLRCSRPARSLASAHPDSQCSPQTKGPGRLGSTRGPITLSGAPQLQEKPPIAAAVRQAKVLADKGKFEA
jgi:hypothetical protein